MKKIKNSPYFVYQSLVDSNQDHDLGSELDDIQLKLLAKIVAKYVEEQPIIISELMRLRFIASPSTIHSRLKKMIEAGYVLALDSAIERGSFLYPTEKATQYYERQSDLIRKSLLQSNV